MKRVRRISLRIEHREVSASITQTITRTNAQTGAAPDDPNSPKTPKASTPPANCRQCGAIGFLDMQDALQQGLIEPAMLQSAALHGPLHMYRQPNGQFWICQRSLELLKESRTGAVSPKPG